MQGMDVILDVTMEILILLGCKWYCSIQACPLEMHVDIRMDEVP